MKMKTLLCPCLMATSLALVALLCPPTAAAATRTWDGSASGFWTNSANWSGSVAPVNGDMLLFPPGPTRLSTTNTAGGATNFTAIVFTGADYVLRSSSLSITNGLTNAAPINSVITLNAPLSPRASQTWESAGKTTLVLNSNITYSALTLTLDNGAVVEANGNFAGGASGDLTKLGAGRLEMNGAANTLDQVRIGDGTLEISGVLTANSLIISNVATLAGSGTGAVFTCAGELRPGGVGGTGLGVLTISGAGASVFQPGGRLQTTLHSPTPGAGYDQLKVSAVLNLAHGSLSVLRDAGFPLALGQKFVIVTNTGAGVQISTFTNLPQGAFITNALPPSTIFQISYTGGSGNDVELTVVDVAVAPTGIARVWDGDATPNLNWTNAVNWAANTLPSPGDDLVFPETVPANRRSLANAFTNGIIFNRLVFGGSNANWNLSGNSFKLLGGMVGTNTDLQRRFATFAPPVELAAAQTFAPTNFTFVFSGELRLGGHTLTMAPATNGAVTCSDSVTGVGSIVMNGGGLLGLRGSNSFTGALTINSGEVDVDHPNTGVTPWLLNGGELNLISGSIPGLQATGGGLNVSVEGGGDPTIAGNLSLGAATTLRVTSLSSASNAAPLVVTGNLTLSGGPLVVENIFLQQLGQTFLLIRNDGPNAVAGTFAGLSQGTIFPVTSEEGASLSLRISYTGGTGNDVTLEFLTPTPTGITRTWSGAGVGSAWTNSPNWNNGSPLNGDSVIFPPGIAATTNSNTPPVFVDRVTWTGSNYVQSGSLLLFGGMGAGQNSGTNTYTGREIFTFGAQTWAVSNAAATLHFAGPPPQLGAANPGWFGTGTITKTGAGTLSFFNYKVFLQSSDFVVTDGTLRLREVGGEDLHLLLTTGRVDVAESSIPFFDATGGEVFIALQAEAGVFPNFGLGAEVITLTSNVTLTLPFTNALSKNTAAIEAQAMDLGGARLNILLNGSEAQGQKLPVAHYATGSLTNTFAGLPEGAVTNVAGFGLQIHYAEMIAGKSGSFITLTVVSAPGPVMTQVQPLPTGDVIVRGTFFPGSTVFIEATQDFASWTDLGSTLVNGAGNFTFIDSTGLPFRFYRARLPGSPATGPQP